MVLVEHELERTNGSRAVAHELEVSSTDAEGLSDDLAL
jgi:hypothetical protein